ncbi:cytolytic toxin-alpha-like [Tachysurus vachellii]|uniref:cytolytic toxin-alpha-like n=1 Tax=Tachysurus vachellii TaxID=175792 RepID=UPI00296ACBC2|nr:cytolytic toxin-alpha-like [Tachysurus vachellii]
MEPKFIQIAALGRALHPGTLYDCRNDSFIPGISLWDNETIKKGLDSRRQPKTELNFSASDSLNEKAKLLDVSASLKASFLGGLVEVGGSAKYMRDNKSSARQSRVSLQYSQTTRYESLTMDQIGNITYPEVFEEGTATHVVTAVMYGAQAFMVFDLTTNENEDQEEIEGNLNVMVRKMPSFSIEGQGALAMSESEKKLANSINCTFYGDYELEQNPTTYMEALQLYRKLPSLLRERENDAVPMKVWLYPLSLLGEKAATLEREIHKMLITEAETLLEDLRYAETQCNDLIANMTINDFQDVRQRLKMFQDFIGSYKMMFLKALSRLIPAIRGGTEQEKALTEIIDIHQKSPFRAEKLNERLEYSHAEVNLMNLYTKQLSGVPVVKYSALMNNMLSDPTVDSVVCFCFTSLMDEDPYLSILTKFLKVDEFEKLSVPLDSADQDIKVWFHKPEVIEKIKDKLYLFKGFFQANKDNTQMRFIIVSVSDPSNPGISIRLYKKGKMVDSAFQPVSKPPAPQVDIQDRNIILKLQKSPTGSTERFRVEYRIINATDSEADVEKWEVKNTPDAQENFTLTGLQLTKQYRIQYRAISEVGMSEASDSVLFNPQGKGKLQFPLNLKWGWSTEYFITELRSKLMNRLGTSQWSPSSIQPVVKNLVKNLLVSITIITSLLARLPLVHLFHRGRGEADPRPTDEGGRPGRFQARPGSFLKAVLEASWSVAHLSQSRPSAPRKQPAQVLFTPAPGYSSPWVQQRKTRAGPPVKDLSPSALTGFRDPHPEPLRETDRDAVIIRDSNIRHVHASVPRVVSRNTRAVVLHACMNNTSLRQSEILKRDFNTLVETDVL